jgi:hypothetical protein
MNKSVRVRVTQKDIDNGEPLCDNDCPIALAVRRTIKRRVGVSYHGVYYTPSMQWAYELPVEVSRFIGRFDRLKPVKPFTFTMKAV